MTTNNISDEKYSRHEEMVSWLNGSLTLGEYKLAPASEDASFRSYYRLEYNGVSRIIMDAPPKQEDVIPFIEINELLQTANIHTPRLYEKSVESGFLLLEDLGTTDYLNELNKSSADSLYHAAMNVLPKIQKIKPVELPKYTEKLLLQEMDLFAEWFIKTHLTIELNRHQSSLLSENSKHLVTSALAQSQVFVHRDYHSRNLMVTNENNPGVIDFQDAVIGPITYDLVSLLKDCYIKWPDEEIYAWVDYFRSVQPLVSDVSRDQFIKWFDLMGIQRHLKAIGIFARLNHRDNKPGYLKDIPRTLSYIIDTAPKYEESLPLMTVIDELDLEKLVQ